MKKIIDIETWSRKEFYLFYKSFASPCYNFSFEADVTHAYDFCKKNNISFFGFCSYVYLRAYNLVENFKYREENEQVVLYDKLDAILPIMKNDTDTQFTMTSAPYEKTLVSFISNLKTIISQTQNGVAPDEKSQTTSGIVCLSCIPWFTFTGGTTAFLSTHQSIPLMSWGKFFERDSKKIMPYFMQSNHMFIDGYHIGQLIKEIEYGFNNPEKL